MSKKPFKIEYKNGKEVELKSINLNDLDILLEKREKLKEFIKDNPTFRETDDDTYQIYEKDEKFQQMVNEIYLFLKIDYTMLKKDNVIDFILPWEEILEQLDAPLLHTMGKIYEYLFPNHRENRIINMNTLQSLASEFSEIISTIREVDKIVGKTLEYSAKELQTFFESDDSDYSSYEDFIRELEQFQKVEKMISNEISSNSLLKSLNELGNRE